VASLVKKSLAILHKTSWCQLLTANSAEELVRRMSIIGRVYIMKSYSVIFSAYYIFRILNSGIFSAEKNQV